MTRDSVSVFYVYCTFDQIEADLMRREDFKPISSMKYEVVEGHIKGFDLLKKKSSLKS